MNLITERNQDVSIVRVNETRLMYPILSEFANTIRRSSAAATGSCCST